MPSHISGKVSWSGSRRVRRSMPESATRKLVSSIAPKPFQPKPNCHAQARNSRPVSNSTNGYWIEIGALQLRHLPRRASQLSSGMFSYQDRACPQCGQCERSTTIPGGGGSYSSGISRISRASRFHCHSRRLGRRRMTTLRKLPTSSPRPAAAG